MITQIYNSILMQFVYIMHDCFHDVIIDEWMTKNFKTIATSLIIIFAAFIC